MVGVQIISNLTQPDICSGLFDRTALFLERIQPAPTPCPSCYWYNSAFLQVCSSFVSKLDF